MLRAIRKRVGLRGAGGDGTGIAVEQTMSTAALPDRSAEVQASGSPQRPRVLLVTYHFPPSGGVAIQRALSCAKYLPQYGCDVCVLTARNAACAVQDPNLADEVPRNVTIYRTFTPELPYKLRDRIWTLISPGRRPEAAHNRARKGPAAALISLPKRLVRSLAQRLFCPDPQVVWVRPAIRQAIRIVRRQRIDAVLVTVPPFSALRIGNAVKRQFPSVKLITEFRDEWLEYYLSTDPAASDHRRAVAEALERETVERSDYVVAVTPPWRRVIRARYGDEPEHKFLCIPNGFDPELFARAASRQARVRDGRLVVTYTGTVYNTPVYSPAAFLDAADSLPEEVRSNIEIRFIGRIAPDAMPLLTGRRCNVRVYGFLPQAQAFEHALGGDCLLLIVGNRAAHSGKVFEYMGMGKPILALSPEDGEVSRLIRETRTGVCVDPSDVASIRRMLMDAYKRFAGAASDGFAPDRIAVSRYARPQLVGDLARATGLCSAAVEGTCASR